MVGFGVDPVLASDFEAGVIEESPQEPLGRRILRDDAVDKEAVRPLDASFLQARVQNLEREVRQLEEEIRYLEEKLRNLDRSVDDLRRRH